MKKRFVIVAVILVLTLQLSACGSAEFVEEVAEKIGVDVSSGKEVTVLDTHSGFHGDGMAYAVLKFSDDKLEKQIKTDERWKKLPLDKGAETLAYGTKKRTDNTIEISGPYMIDEDKGNVLMPKVENGYYFLLNKENNKISITCEEIKNASSLNVILAIYDTDKRMLYFCELDT